MTQDSLFDEGDFESDDDMTGHWTISGEGLETVANWARFQIELHRMAPDTFGDIDDDELSDDAKLAYLVWFLVREGYESRGLLMPGVEKGDLFPKEWDED